VIRDQLFLEIFNLGNDYFFVWMRPHILPKEYANDARNTLVAHSSELLLPSRDERRQRSTTWEAAEALFRPKEPAAEPATPVAREPIEPSVRKPQVLPAAPPPLSLTTRAEPRMAKPLPAPAAIPPSHAARIRTWIKYGMTPRQVAALYRVAVTEVRQVLGQA
jgi:hypothetical protein